MDVLLIYGGQARVQEAAVQQTFRLEVERSSFFYLSSLINGMCETQTLAAPHGTLECNYAP